MERKRSAYKMLVGKLKKRRPPGRSGCRWEENIEIYLKILEGGWIGFVSFRIGTNGGLL
jgi:hypothetical protein